uniref:Uncharacterized protein n=1 Tax=Arundo donax TaxID=35708 RepID=A0A0A9C5S1_ARUDO
MTIRKIELHRFFNSRNTRNPGLTLADSDLTVTHLDNMITQDIPCLLGLVCILKSLKFLDFLFCTCRSVSKDF